MQIFPQQLKGLVAWREKIELGIFIERIQIFWKAAMLFFLVWNYNTRKNYFYIL